MRRNIILALTGIALGWFIGSARADEFTDALNVERQNRGLQPVAYDASLEPIAEANNNAQIGRGLGHWVTGGYGQCAAIGPQTALAALAMYFRSAGHAAMLLHPSATRIGVRHAAACQTTVIAFYSPWTWDPTTQQWVWHYHRNTSAGANREPEKAPAGTLGAPLPAACQSNAPASVGIVLVPARRGFHPFRAIGRAFSCQ